MMNNTLMRLSFVGTLVLAGFGCEAVDPEAPDEAIEELAAAVAERAGVEDYEVVLHDAEPVDDAGPETSEDPSLDPDFTAREDAQLLPPVGCTGSIWIGHSCRRCWIQVPTAGCTLTATDCGGGPTFSGC